MNTNAHYKKQKGFFADCSAIVKVFESCLYFVAADGATLFVNYSSKNKRLFTFVSNF